MNHIEEKLIKDSSTINLTSNDYTCYYCKSEEPLAFHIEEFKVKLIGIACILNKSGSYKKDEISPLINLKKVVIGASEPLLHDWETFSEYLDPKIRKVDKDADILENQKFNNELERLQCFIEDFNEKLIEFRNYEASKILEIQNINVNKVKVIAKKIKQYKEFYLKIKRTIESENISEAFSVLSLILNPKSDFNQDNFRNEIIQMTKMLNEYVESSEKNKISINSQSSLISQELSLEIDNCLNYLTTVFTKIKREIQKNHETITNDPSKFNNNLFKNISYNSPNYICNNNYSQINNSISIKNNLNNKEVKRSLNNYNIIDDLPEKSLDVKWVDDSKFTIIKEAMCVSEKNKLDLEDKDLKKVSMYANEDLEKVAVSLKTI